MHRKSCINYHDMLLFQDTPSIIDRSHLMDFRELLLSLQEVYPGLFRVIGAWCINNRQKSDLTAMHIRPFYCCCQYRAWFGFQVSFKYLPMKAKATQLVSQRDDVEPKVSMEISHSVIISPFKRIIRPFQLKEIYLFYYLLDAGEFPYSNDTH